VSCPRSGLKRFFIGNTANSSWMPSLRHPRREPPDFASRVPRTGRGVQILSLPILPG
jgi:hypothetical protein